MVRFEGASAAVREAFRPWALDAMTVVTAFGGATVLLFVLSLWFWVGDRRKIATVVSYAFVALSLVLVLKTLFGLPRPPASVQTVATAEDPYGFPSGHAVAAVVVYGGLTTVYGRLDRNTVGVVAVVVALIGLSRIVVGVHYLGDVLAGTAVGLAVLATLWRVVGQNPTAGFAVAVGISAVAMGLGAPERALAFGGAIGGLAGSTVLDRIPDPRSTAERVVLVVAGVPLLVAGTELLDSLGSIPALVVGNSVLVTLIFLLPLAITMLPLGGSPAATGPG